MTSLTRIQTVGRKTALQWLCFCDFKNVGFNKQDQKLSEKLRYLLSLNVIVFSLSRLPVVSVFASVALTRRVLTRTKYSPVTQCLKVAYNVANPNFSGSLKIR